MRKFLLGLCSILAVMAFAGCSMPSFGSGGSLDWNGSSQGSDLPDDSKDSGGNSSGGSGGEIGGEDKPTDSVKPDGSGGNAGGDAEDPSLDPDLRRNSRPGKSLPPGIERGGSCLYSPYPRNLRARTGLSSL